METIQNPTFEYKLLDIPGRKPMPRIFVDEPNDAFCDLSNILHSHYETLIPELEAVLQGRIEKTGHFGGERVICTAYPDITVCYDTHQDHTMISVSTTWMLNLIQGFYEFKKPYFGGYGESVVVE